MWMIVELGELFSIRVVGEGIEREDQLLALGELGCEMGQGYLLGRPVELSRGVALAPPRAPAFTA
jgi:EAL domain-containing protein (putative c-di-GMP-specific phosphodiesterase class I)